MHRAKMAPEEAPVRLFEERRRAFTHPHVDHEDGNVPAEAHAILNAIAFRRKARIRCNQWRKQWVVEQQRAQKPHLSSSCYLR